MQSLIELIEPRVLFAAVFPTNFEQYELELINRARANPTAEAARHGIALNEGLAPNTITTAAKQPLAINPNITDAARKHSQWMIDNDVFAHDEGANDPGDRMASAGYVFSGSWTWGENIAYRSSSGSAPDPTTTAALLHADLFIDEGIAGRGHRTNIMSNAFKEIGVGFATGTFNSQNALMLTTDFGKTGTSSFLTGVAYADAGAKDNFYTPGEGLAGATITAKRTSDNATFTTQTWTSGGYSLALAAGTYTVTATGGGLASPVSFSNVTIGSENVKRDFTSVATVVGTGIIRGFVFHDRNHNAIQDAGEEGLAGVIVYLDTHRDGKRNAGERYTRTTATGAYKIDKLVAGTYRVRQTAPSGFAFTSPRVGYHTAIITTGRILGGRNFGDELI